MTAGRTGAPVVEMRLCVPTLPQRVAGAAITPELRAIGRARVLSPSTRWSNDVITLQWILAALRAWHSDTGSDG